MVSRNDMAPRVEVPYAMRDSVDFSTDCSGRKRRKVVKPGVRGAMARAIMQPLRTQDMFERTCKYDLFLKSAYCCTFGPNCQVEWVDE